MLYNFSYFVHNSLGLHFWDLPRKISMRKDKRSWKLCRKSSKNEMNGMKVLQTHNNKKEE